MSELDLHVFGIEATAMTGAGEIQRALETQLPGMLPASWNLRSDNGSASIAARLLTQSTARASLWICTPLPILLRSRRHAHFVFDLRWQETRSRIARIYRRVDLHRIARRADVIFAISHHMADEITKAIGDRTPVVVVPMGPGQVEGRPRSTLENTRTLLLMGRAPHKRNEELAALLAQSEWIREQYTILAVSVSDETKHQLLHGKLRVEFHDGVDSETFGQLLDRASCYIGLSTDEGFGLPFVEAAYCGCDVVAIDLPVAREAIGENGNFLSCRNPTVREIEAALAAWDGERVTALRESARTHSWMSCAETVVKWLKQI